MATIGSSAIYLYGASTPDLTAAMWAATVYGVPLKNVTGELHVANPWVGDGKVVITVGSIALNQIMNQGGYTNFCSYQAKAQAGTNGPIDACGSDSLDSWKLAYAQVEAALNGTYPSDYTSATPCDYNGVACTT
jgi:hypothetical protein